LSRKVFHELVHPDDVLRVVEEFVSLKPLGVEVVGLDRAFGRVLAEDVRAAWDAPPFDRSEVDGYAVSSESVVGAEEDSPVKLRVTGYVRIGEVPTIEVRAGEAVEIDTGAMLPRGADSVVMVEHTKRVNDDVLVFRSVVSGENVARAGSDILKGEVVLRKGTLLGPGEVASLAAVGMGRVKVYRKVKVAVMSIGNELREPGSELRGAEVFDVNTYAVTAAVSELGAVPVKYGVFPDDESLIEDGLRRALSECDVVLTSGGTSAGIGDLTYRILERLGEPGIIVHGLKLKPGKPTIVAVVNGKVVVGLPGFPLSAMMAFKRVAAPIIAKLAGIKPYALSSWRVRAKLALRITGVRGKVMLVPVALIEHGDDLVAYPVRTHSGSVHVLTYADGFVEVPENTGILEEGSEVKVELFKRGWAPPALVVIGSHDYLMETLTYSVVGDEGEAKVLRAGSMGGVLAVGRGEADIGGTHILDAESGEYNIPVIRKLGLDDKVRLVRGWGREIGLVVARGNPKQINGFEDLLRKDVLFINRNRGSGTRTLVDIKLKEVASRKGLSFSKLRKMIRGYWNEVRTHTAVAAAIAQGRADVGVAIRWAADLYGLDFIKVGEEIYDIVIHRNSLSKPAVKEILHALRSEELDNLMRNFTGYKRLSNTGEFLI